MRWQCAIFTYESQLDTIRSISTMIAMNKMSDETVKSTLDYKSAGVDIDAGNELVERIKPIVKATHRPGVIGGLGGFGGLFELPLDRYKNPILVSGTDGVGTKLRVAIDLGIHDTVGIDLVAMCVNDIIVTGAEPLYFLDYFATGKLEVEQATDVIKGIADGCKQAGAALIGGETAEMPGMYSQGDYDLAGFAVGIVERDKAIDGSTVGVGDQLIGIASTGPHSNGYSLIRKIIETSGASLDQPFGDTTLGRALIAPTQIYVKQILKLLESYSIKALAHNTGGGLPENLPRVLPEGTSAQINLKSWDMPAIFQWLQEHGNIAQFELLRTFNCGIGMVLCVAKEDVDGIMSSLKTEGLASWHIGEITKPQDNKLVKFIE